MASGTYYPAVSGDDGHWVPADFQNTLTQMYFGMFLEGIGTFIRCPNITIPQGSTITSAYIRFTAYSSLSSTVVNVNVYFNDVDDAIAPTSSSEGDALSLTSPITWNGVEAWTDGIQYDTPSLASILQSVINRTGWSSGNALQIVIKDNGSSGDYRYRSASTIDYLSGAEKAELHVAWVTDTEITLPNPFLATASLQSNIQIEIVPGPLQAETSMSIGEPFWGTFIELPSPFAAQSLLQAKTGLEITITPLIVQTNLQSNIQIELVPPAFAVQSEMSVGEIWCGVILFLPNAFEAINSGQCDVNLYFQRVTKIISPLGDQSQTNIINSFGEQAQNVISVALGLENKQLTKLDLSPGVQEIQKFLLRLCEGDPFISLQSLKNQFVYDKREIQKVLNTISNSVESIQAISQTISLGDVASLQKLLLEIAEKDYVLGQQNLLQSLENLGASYFSVEYDVLLDGVSIKKNTTDVIISYREDSVHNSISIRSADKELFWKCDPLVNEGISRIEVRIGTRQIYFLLEKRTGDEKVFSFWGRSISAREDTPYAEDLDYSLDEPKSAKAVVEEILIVSSLDWQCDDWILPTSFEFEGTPMEGISQIVNAIGAIVRCKDDGTILVRQRFPVRPINMNGADVAVSYDRSHLTRLDYENYKGLQYNAVEVVGFTDDVGLPDMAVEESSPVMGDNVHVRVYWAGNKPSGGIATYVTDGNINILGEETSEEDEAETVTFMDGIASVSRPITSITNFEWIGDSGGNINYEKFSKDLEIANEAYRIGEITYKATYSRYCVSDHDVEVLLALLTFGGESDVSVEVKMGAGDRSAPDLNLPLLTSQSIAVVAGTAWLDENKYDKKKVVLETPYNDNVIDGVLVYVNNAEINCIGNFHIEDCNISIKGPRVINEIGVLQCQV
ncbi:MAG: hypothetical protein KAU17_08035 [Spirochaetales bacterium]|nr:hypothetical protein [Spirochaetales bacterium]